MEDGGFVKISLGKSVFVPWTRAVEHLRTELLPTVSIAKGVADDVSFKSFSYFDHLLT